MSLLNSPRSGAAGYGNTGIPGKFVDPKNIIGMILANPSKKFIAADMLNLTTFKAKLQADCLDTDEADRIFPFFKFNSWTDKSTDSKTETSGYDEQRQVAYGKYAFEAGYWNGGLSLHANVFEGFNGSNYQCYLVDRDNVILGRKNSSGDLMPFTSTISFKPMTFGDGSKGANYSVFITLSNIEELNTTSQFGYMDCGANRTGRFDVAAEILGNWDVVVAVAANIAANVTVTAKLLLNDNYNLYDYFADDLEEVTAWMINKVSDGSVVTISAVAKVAASKGWKLTHAFGGAVLIKMATPAILAATPIFVGGPPNNGFESNVIPVTTTV